MTAEKLWGKRFEKPPSPLAQKFTSGRDVQGKPAADERLIPYDIWGSRAHVVMLAKAGILPGRQARILSKGLHQIEDLWRQGGFLLDPFQEDVHTNIEGWLTKKYGSQTGGRLHTARSRNDQIAVDMRLYLRDCALTFSSEVLFLLEVLIRLARRHRDQIFPGYTHHQPAQVTTLGHILLGFGESFLRDAQRFQEWFDRFNKNPLGSMTGYSTTLRIDRKLTSKLMGFDGPTQSSLDPIQNRWEAEAELGFALSTLMNHLSSLAQTLILFSTGEFNLIHLDDSYCTGSSMMPQKRNPDPLEVTKAKAALIHGHLQTLISIGRSLFLGYNRDTQWTKYLVMDLIDESASAPKVMAEILASIQVNGKRAAELCQMGFITSPDLVERLVAEWHIPFRLAKKAVERAVRYSEAEGADKISLSAFEKALKEEKISVSGDQKFIDRAQNPKILVGLRKATGGSSPEGLKENISNLDRSKNALLKWVSAKRSQISSAESLLRKQEKAIYL
jgi:argininosuccinate lyase